MDTSSQLYTIIRVKRKLNDSISDRHNSFKRLRHIGSFVNKQDEEKLQSSNILKQMGFNARKRVKINDLNSEQFHAYVEKYDDSLDSTESKKKPNSTPANTTHNDESVLNIDFTPSDLDSNGKTKDVDNKEPCQITCNGEVLECVKSENKADQYVYDYYVLMDNLIDFQSTSEKEECFDDDEPSSNDENYRYNDYPDEDEFSDASNNSGTNSEYSFDTYNDSYELNNYSDSFCDDFNKLDLKNHNYSDDDDYE